MKTSFLRRRLKQPVRCLDDPKITICIQHCRWALHSIPNATIDGAIGDSREATMPDKYANYVDHPRYGRGPNLTGLNPDYRSPKVTLHWNATTPTEAAERYRAITGEKWPTVHGVSCLSVTKRIPNTAVAADLTAQAWATVPVTHYFDVERICRDCDRWFIFFAEEQKHWYEELGFGLDSDCVRCVPCRKRQQGIGRQRQRYEELFHVSERTVDENLEMAECCLSLIEASVFNNRQAERVRMLLNRIPSDASGKVAARHKNLTARVRAIAPT